MKNELSKFAGVDAMMLVEEIEDVNGGVAVNSCTAANAFDACEAFLLKFALTPGITWDDISGIWDFDDGECGDDIC